VPVYSFGLFGFGAIESFEDIVEIPLSKGIHTIEIAAESQLDHVITFDDYKSKFLPPFISDAEFFVKTIIITGMDKGGAA
jgi:hypothetical protein